jgi:competence protein ComEC
MFCNIPYYSSLIKITLILLLISVFYIKKAKVDLYFKSVLGFVFIFGITFCVASVYSNLLKENEVYFNEKVNLEAKIIDIEERENNTLLTVIPVNEYKNINKILLYSHENEFHLGDLISVEGDLQSELILNPSRRLNTNSNDIKGFDLVKSYSNKDIDAIMMYPKLILLKANDINTINNLAYKLRLQIRDTLVKQIGGVEGSVAIAMLIGDETRLSQEINNLYKNAGVSHILVLSGYNLAIVVAFVLLLTHEKSRKIQIPLLITFLLAFLFVVKLNPPIIRAAFMSFYSLGALILMKAENARVALWLSTLIYIFWQGIEIIWDLSFILSFLATASIIYYYPLLKDIVFKLINQKSEILKSKFIKTFLEFILVTVSANILIAPYILYSFGYFKLMGLVCTILVSIFVPVVMLLSFLTIIFSVFSSFIAGLIGTLDKLFIAIINYLVKIFSAGEPLIRDSLSLQGLFKIYFILIFIYQVLKFHLNVLNAKK